MGLSQVAFAKLVGVTQATLSGMERGISPVSTEVLYGLACNNPEVDLHYLLCGQQAQPKADIYEIASHVRPVIRALGDGLDDLPPDGVADDYLAVPLLDGKVAAGPGGVVWERVKSLVWLYRPELGRRRRLVAVKVAGSSMEPTIPSGAIIIIDRDLWEPQGNRKHIWALRTENGDTQIKRLHRVNGGLLVVSDNFADHGPEIAWTNDLKKLVIGQVIWMWRSLY